MAEPQINRIQTPIDMAFNLLQGENERIPGQLLGPERPTRQQKVDGVSQDVIIEEVLKDLEVS